MFCSDDDLIVGTLHLHRFPLLLVCDDTSLDEEILRDDVDNAVIAIAFSPLTFLQQLTACLA